MKASEKANQEVKAMEPVVEKAAERADHSRVRATAPALESVPVPAEIVMSIDEFCRQWSETERRVALLGAFHFEMKRKNRLSGFFSEYRAAYADFINAPA